MTKDSLIIQERDLSVYASRSRIGAVMTIIGALMIVIAFAYSSHALVKLQHERSDQETLLQQAKLELEQLRVEREKIHTQLQSLQNQMRKARESSSYVQLGLKMFFRQNYSGAITHYDQAIRIDAKNPVLYDLKGYALFRLNRFDEAVDSLRQATTLDPEYIWGHYNLALAYWASNEPTLAVAEVNAVVRLDPRFRDVIKGDGQFNKFRSSPEFRKLVGLVSDIQEK